MFVCFKGTGEGCRGLNEAWKNGPTVAADASSQPWCSGLPYCTLLDLLHKGLIKAGEI